MSLRPALYGPAVFVPGSGMFGGMPDGLPSSTEVLDLWSAFDPAGECVEVEPFVVWLRDNHPGQVAAVVVRSRWPL